jgi:hypothetical protein
MDYARPDNPADVPSAGEAAALVGRLLSRQAELSAEQAKVSAELAALLPIALDPVPLTPPQRLLTPEEAAAMVGIEPRQLARLTRDKPCRRKLGHKTIRYEEAGLRRLLLRKAS